MKFPFRRKNDVSAVPAEIQEYYQTERRERTGIAWLLALGTLIITIGLATLLFFGGRWAYRAVVDNDDNSPQTAQTEEDGEESGSPAGSSSEPSNPQTGTSSTSTSTPNNPTTTPSQTPTGATTPATGSSTSSSVAGSSTELPNTGAGDIVAIFTATTVVASAAHYAISSRRTNS